MLLRLCFVLALLAPLCGRAEPALWRVRGPHATVWLFGTVHALKPGTAWLTPRVEGAVRSSRALWLEIADAESPTNAAPLFKRYGEDPTQVLAQVIPPADSARLDGALASSRLTAAQVQHMRPWLVGMLVDLAPVAAAGYDPSSGADVVLSALAHSESKPIMGFETAEQQIRLFADLPLDQQIAYLENALDDVDKGKADLDKIMTAWAAGDVPALETLMNADLELHSQALYRLLLVERNQRFAERIAELARGRGTYFVAVGAAHLAGPDSVQADLTRLGLAAQRQ